MREGDGIAAGVARIAHLKNIFWLKNFIFESKKIEKYHFFATRCKFVCKMLSFMPTFCQGVVPIFGEASGTMSVRWAFFAPRRGAS